jgi:hypothetical protein
MSWKGVEVELKERHIKKKTFTILSLVGLIVANVNSQSTEENTTPTERSKPADALQLDPEVTQKQIESMFRYQTDLVSRMFGVDVTVDGIVPRLIRAEEPLQLINPLAPPEYGIGMEILSINPRPEHPAVINRKVEGFSFFTFRF